MTGTFIPDMQQARAMREAMENQLEQQRATLATLKSREIANNEEAAAWRAKREASEAELRFWKASLERACGAELTAEGTALRENSK